MTEEGDGRGAAYVAGQLTRTLEAIARVTGEIGELARSTINNNELKSLYGVTWQRVGLFCEGRDTPDLSCSVEVGAATAVGDRAGSSIKFEKYVDLAEVYRAPPTEGNHAA
jgi:hypothetical protein